MPQFWVLGINHKTAPLAFRERLAFSGEQVQSLLQARLTGSKASLKSAAAPPVVLLSTCNRTELYGVTSGEAQNPSSAADGAAWLAAAADTPLPELTAHSYQYDGAAAARHLFGVASGLDSMVLGETQILGQLKDALRLAQQSAEAGQARDINTLQPLFDASFKAAKAVRSQTDIGTQSISMAAAAVRLAQGLFEDLGSLRVLFVGAGEMVTLCAKHFAAQNPACMTVANRTRERGAELLAQLKTENGFAGETQLLNLAHLTQHLHEFDVVISCTASTLPIIGLGAMEAAIKQRRRRPMLVVDLAVPRDIEPQVAKLRDVYLYTVDDLGAQVQLAKANRSAAVAAAQQIIDAEVDNFMKARAQRLAVSQASSLVAQIQAQLARWQVGDEVGNEVGSSTEQRSEKRTTLRASPSNLQGKLMHQVYQLLKTDPQAAHTLLPKLFDLPPQSASAELQKDAT